MKRAIESTLDGGGGGDALDFHKNSFQRFALKREISQYSNASGDPQAKRTCQVSSSTALFMKGMCIFCEKTKYKPKSNSRQPLTPCSQLLEDSKLAKMVVESKNERLQKILSQDLTGEGYHRSCYRDNTRGTMECETGKSKSEETDEVKLSELNTEEMEIDSECIAETESFKQLFEFIRKEIIVKPRIVKMVDLLSKFTDIMKHAGLDQVRETTKKHFRRSLEREFKDGITVFPDDKGKLLVMPSVLTKMDLARENVKLTEQLETMQHESQIESKLDAAALCIRECVMKGIITKEFPYTPTMQSLTAFEVPPEIRKFLLCLLTGTSNPLQVTHRVEWLVQSFSQDMIYAVSCGRQKPPKHILLATAVKALTGNTELMQAMNRWGHCTSYWLIEENETALCLKKLAALMNGLPGLPDTVYPYLMTTLSWDNIDILEETLTGGGTSHRINGIIIQQNSNGPHLPKAEIQVPQLTGKRKPRSIVIEDLNLPYYHRGQKHGPGEIQCKGDNYYHINMMSFTKTMIWFLARHSDSDRKISSWTGFNMKARKGTDIIEDKISYLPTIDAPATEMSTAMEILRQSRMIMKELQLQNIVLVFDQALFAKVAEVAWKDKEENQGIVLRMGEFHTMCNFMAIIGKRFQDAGLRDLCIESGLITGGSVDAVMDGRHYNRGIRIHKCVYEGLLRLAWNEFPDWLMNNHPNKQKLHAEVSELVSCLHNEVTKENYELLLNDSTIEEAVALFDEFLDHLRSNNGAMSALWMSYIDMVGQCLLGLLRASREGDWYLHLAAIHTLIPWCFAYDRMNYSRYLPIYYAEMENLQEKHPDVHNYFVEGGFSVQLGSENPFGKIAVDQAIEETVNKDTKGSGGIRKYSLNKGAVQRHYMTSEYRSAYISQFRKMIGLGKRNLHHAELTNSRIAKDHILVDSVVDTIQGWVNPFKSVQDIVCLSNAVVASPEVQNDLLRAKKCGEKAFKEYMDKRVGSNELSIHEPIARNKLKTFSDMSKQSKVKINGKEIIMKADKNTFARVILISETRKDIKMRIVLGFPLGPLPWSLATADGFMRKTNKAVPVRELQRNIPQPQSIPENSATIIDTMDAVHRVKVCNQSTFEEVSDAVLNIALKDAAKSKRFDLVSDVYNLRSIKNVERMRRSGGMPVALQSISPNQKVCHWDKFLKSVGNKKELIKFLVSQWKRPEKRIRLKEKTLYVTCEDKCFKITRNSCVEVEELESSQEEADTRILLHAHHAAHHGSKTVVICAEDSDIFYLCLYFNLRIPAKIIMRQKKGTTIAYHDIGKIEEVHGHDFCQALLGLHAFTGCDSVSSFAGKGKLRAMRLLKKDHVKALTELGDTWNLSSTAEKDLEIFTCAIYGYKDDTSINEVRYKLFVDKKGNIDSHQLPPCKDTFNKKCKRTNYTVSVWKKSLEQKPDIEDAVGHGWKEDNGTLVIDWMSGKPAPDSVLSLLACKCPKECKPDCCPCMMNTLKCSEMCKLQTCQNQPDPDINVEVYADENDDDVLEDVLGD